MTAYIIGYIGVQPFLCGIAKYKQGDFGKWVLNAEGHRIQAEAEMDGYVPVTASHQCGHHVRARTV